MCPKFYAIIVLILYRLIAMLVTLLM